MTELHVCRICGELLPKEKFWNSKRHTKGINTACIECLEQRRKGYKGGSKRERRDRHLRTNYGLSLKDYERTYEAQHGECAICGEKHDVLMVDHEHTSNVVRELLCSKCNVALGLFKDNVDILREAADYIEKHNANIAFTCASL